MVTVGRIGMPYSDLFLLNKEEREALNYGYNFNQRDLLYGLRRHSVLTLSPHLKKGLNLPEYKLWPFEWEAEPEVYKATKEDIEATRLMWENIDKMKQDGKSKN
jgi:hypothetical protein